MHKSAMKCNETVGKWCKNKHGASKIIDTFETYQRAGGKKEMGMKVFCTQLEGTKNIHCKFDGKKRREQNGRFTSGDYL
jgi:hypothetical protein